MSEKIRIVAGVDVGGTNTVTGLVDRSGAILAQGTIPTVDYPQADKYAQALAASIKRLMEGLGDGYELAGIGIGAPNANYYTGIIENAANLAWTGAVPLAEMVGVYFPGVRVVLTNDANAAAVGEMAYGGARGMNDFIVMTLGTGVGSGFVAGGKVIYGHDSFAGELGHTIIHPGGRQCGCGRCGCLETYTSAIGIKRTAMELMATMTCDSVLRGVDCNHLSAKIIAEAAEAGDRLALEVFEHAGRYLGLALANAVAVTSPEAIFLFGGVARAGKLIFEPTKRHMELNMLANYSNKVKLLPSQLMEANAAVLGASALAW